MRRGDMSGGEGDLLELFTWDRKGFNRRFELGHY